MRGFTRILAVVDEYGWFPFGLTDEQARERERADAREIYRTLQSSVLTVRNSARRQLFKANNANALTGMLFIYWITFIQK